MAVKGSGIVARTIDPPMQDRVTQSPINPRSGAAKRTQEKVAIKEGMRSRVGEQFRDEPGAKGSGPDASGPNVMDPTKRKEYPKAPAAWGMLDPNKQSVNHELGQRVLDEAQLAVQYSGDKSRASDAAR